MASAPLPGAALAALALVVPVAPACSPVGDAERLWVSGELEREAVYGSETDAVPVEYLSEGSRGEWWPCDLRLTAQGCVDGHHVNVYLAPPSALDLDGVGSASCVQDGVPHGVYELLDDARGGEHDLGSDVSAFVVIASDTGDDTAGADLDEDEETTAASRLTSGTLDVSRFRGLEDTLSLVVDGTTSEGRAVHIEFTGPTSSPGVVPTLEAPRTCVEDALIGEGP